MHTDIDRHTDTCVHLHHLLVLMRVPRYFWAVERHTCRQTWTDTQTHVCICTTYWSLWGSLALSMTCWKAARVLFRLTVASSIADCKTQDTALSTVLVDKSTAHASQGTALSTVLVDKSCSTTCYYVYCPSRQKSTAHASQDMTLSTVLVDKSTMLLSQYTPLSTTIGRQVQRFW